MPSRRTGGSETFRACGGLPRSAGTSGTNPGWRATKTQFFAEVGNRITYPYNAPDRGGDAVAHWALADSWREPSRPLITYTPGRVRGTLPGLAANRLARHEKSAKWFSHLQRNQGRTLLFHGHLKPALLRDREPQYVKWEGTIWHSTRTDNLMEEGVARQRRASSLSCQTCPADPVR